MKVPFEELLGKTLTGVKNDVDEVTFTTTDGFRYRMYHENDCCESVSVEDVCGDLNDLVGWPILLAEESSSEDPPPEGRGGEGSWTWTFYRLGTAKGYVTIRWYGESNGYYSESVDFERAEG